MNRTNQALRSGIARSSTNQQQQQSHHHHPSHLHSHHPPHMNNAAAGKCSSFKLEKSRQSARECRARKKLRYEYLEELVADREKAIITLQRELSQFKEYCDQIDAGQITDKLRNEVATWKCSIQPDSRNLSTQASSSPTSP